MSTPFSRIEMNLQNEGQGHMDRLREQYVFGGGGVVVTDGQNYKRGSYLL